MAFNLLIKPRKGPRDGMPEQTTTSAIKQLKPWFQNLHPPNGAQTTPIIHRVIFLADKWRQLSPHIPPDG